VGVEILLLVMVSSGFRRVRREGCFEERESVVAIVVWRWCCGEGR
jgi:hypothetical protein